MDRGELYLAVPPDADPKRQRVYVVVSRPEFIQSRYSTIACVPVYSTRTGVPTEVHLGPEDGLKIESAARCDEVTSVSRIHLQRFIGSLSSAKMRAVSRGLAEALSIGPDDLSDT